MLRNRSGIPSPTAALLCVLLASPVEGIATEGSHLRVTASLANVRSDPSVQGTVVFQVRRGEELVGVGESGDWYEVEGPGGKRGYLLKTLAEAVEAAPAPPPSAPPSQPQASTPQSRPAPQPQAAGSAIDHKPLDCVLAGAFPKVGARFSAQDLARGRVYFKAEGHQYWYYVDMAAVESGHEAILPKPKPTTKKIDYYVEAVGKSFGSSRTQEYGPTVVRQSMECKSKMMAPNIATAKVLVGSETPGAPSIPDGFDPAGITSAVATSAVGATSAASASSHTLLFVAGGVAAAAGIAVAAKGGGTSSPVSVAIDLTGTWVGPISGQISAAGISCSYSETVTVSLTQAGASVGGSGTIANYTFSCPLAGTISRSTGGGTFSGTASGGQITFATSNGVTFTGTYTGTSMSGTLKASYSGNVNESGTWSFTKQ